MYPKTYDGHLKRELVKYPYPPLVMQDTYIVARGRRKNGQTLYSGHSHDVARLIINTMPGAYLLQYY